MSPASPELVEQLRASHLFSRLSKEGVLQAAEMGERVSLRDGETLFRQGSRPACFYLLLEGNLHLSASRDGRHKHDRNLVPGDTTGESDLLDRRPHTATAVATCPTVLFKLDGGSFERLVQSSQEFRVALALELRTRHLARQADLRWLSTSETIHFIAHRHRFFLIAGLVLPILIFLSAVGLFVFLYWTGVEKLVPYLAAGALSAAGLGWAAWNGLDWGNDFYLVSNQRVVWMEKVMAFYDSRQEAPLATILSVGITTSQAGRIFGWGDVVVRTYTGTVTFRRVGSPKAVAALVEEHWHRATNTSQQGEAQAMEQAIRRRLGRAEEGELAEAAPTLAVEEPQDQAPRAWRPGTITSWLAGLFRLRYEEGVVITYRKHWFILIRNTWRPALIALFLISLGVARATETIRWLSSPAFFTLIGGLLVGVGCWYLYQYLDWRNDIFQVTSDQVVDVDKKPLGREERRAAPLDNILSIQYERLGIIGLLFNFGTVTITVGNARLTFDMVYNPSQVQKDLFNRMEARNVQKRQAELASERERVSGWFAVYNGIASQPAPPPLPDEDFNETRQDDGPFWG